MHLSLCVCVPAKSGLVNCLEHMCAYGLAQNGRLRQLFLRGFATVSKCVTCQMLEKKLKLSYDIVIVYLIAKTESKQVN